MRSVLSYGGITADRETKSDKGECMTRLSIIAVIAFVAMSITVKTQANRASAADSAHAVQNETTDSSQKKQVTPDNQLLFFLNPNGRPCQIQSEILDGMHEKLASLARITHVKTTESADQKLFYRYGIRGLPSMIILDKNGKELKRFTPGIQDEKSILAAFGKLSK
jgi:hypothetical protein